MDAIVATAPGATIDLAIDGMHCAGCAGRIERALEALPGVSDAAVNLATARARVGVMQGGPGAEALARAVADLGYRARTLEAETPPALPAADPVLPVVLAFAVALPLAADMAARMLSGRSFLPFTVQLGLGTIAVFGLGAPFLRGAWRALRAGAADMDVLVTLGTLAAWCASLAAPFLAHAGVPGGDVSFASAALIIAFVRLGKLLESRARRGTARVVADLGALRPATVRRVRDGSVQTIPLADLRVGDVVELRVGDRIPADGRIVEGEAGIDLSTLTGETLPVHRGVGEGVPSGGLVTDATLRIAATAVGGETTLARIARRIDAAQASKAPIERAVDRVARVFVPAMLVLAAISLAAHLALGAAPLAAIADAVSVLVIACPCALGLATPVAIVAGTGAAARAGILIKDAAAIERARTIRTVAFDKTGTLTEGLPVLDTIVTAPGETEYQVLRDARALSEASLHPLAGAIRARADATPDSEPGAAPGATALRVHAGRGIEGDLAGARLVLGSTRLLAERGVPPALVEEAAAMAAQGRTVSGLAVLGATPRLRALFGFSDRIRPNAARAISLLRARGIAAVMLTGDGPDAARAIAREAGIATWQASLLPEDKQAALGSLGPRGTVAMVGDGINDGPALAAAGLGIAMAQGVDLAIEAADIALLRADPLLVPAALDIARRTARKVREGLVWAFAYNLVGIPLALAGLVGPAFAGAAMAASSLIVVCNALLLRRWRPA